VTKSWLCKKQAKKIARRAIFAPTGRGGREEKRKKAGQMIQYDRKVL